MEAEGGKKGGREVAAYASDNEMGGGSFKIKNPSNLYLLRHVFLIRAGDYPVPVLYHMWSLGTRFCTEAYSLP